MSTDERLRQSPRVAELAKVLAKYTVHVRIGVELTDEEALDLFRAGDLRRILVDFERRLAVTRVAPGMADDPEFQQRLAVVEVVAAAAGLNASERGDIIRRTMAAQQSWMDEVASTAKKASAVQEQLSGMDTTNRQLRVFLRDVERLYARQVGYLRTRVKDPSVCQSAVHRLDEIYTHHITLAISRVGVE